MKLKIIGVVDLEVLGGAQLDYLGGAQLDEGDRQHQELATTAGQVIISNEKGNRFDKRFR